MGLEILDSIKDKAVNKKIIVVEGETDLESFEKILKKKFKERGKKFEDSYFLADVGGKGMVLKALKKEPDWIGIIDRDTWDDILKRFNRKLEEVKPFWVALEVIMGYIMLGGLISILGVYDQQLVKGKI